VDASDSEQGQTTNVGGLAQMTEEALPWLVRLLQSPRVSYLTKARIKLFYISTAQASAVWLNTKSSINYVFVYICTAQASAVLAEHYIKHKLVYISTAQASAMWLNTKSLWGWKYHRDQVPTHYKSLMQQD